MLKLGLQLGLSRRPLLNGIDAPVITGTSGITTSAITLEWSAVTGADHYEVKLNGVLVDAAVATTSYEFTGLSEGTAYTLGVLAVDASSNKSDLSTLVASTNFTSYIPNSTHEWLFPSLTDRIGSADGTNNGAASGSEADLSKTRNYFDFVSTESDYIDFGDCGSTAKSLVMIIKLDSTTENILQNNVNGLSCSSGTLTYTDWDNAFVSKIGTLNEDTDTVVAGEWIQIILTSTTGVDCSNFELGRIGASYGNFACTYVGLSTEELIASQMKTITEKLLLEVNTIATGGANEYTVPAASVSTNLEAHYVLNGNSNDTSVNEHVSTDYNMDWTLTSPDGRNVAAYNGSSSRIILPALGIGGSGARTIDMWLYPNSITTNYTVFHSGNVAAFQQFYININAAGRNGCVYLGCNTSDFATEAGMLNLSAWNHIAIIYDGGTLSASTVHIVVNGKEGTLTKFGAGTGAANTADTNYALGYYRPASSTWYAGRIRECEIYSRAKTLTEVDQRLRDSYID